MVNQREREDSDQLAGATKIMSQAFASHIVKQGGKGVVVLPNTKDNTRVLRKGKVRKKLRKKEEISSKLFNLEQNVINCLFLEKMS